MTPTNNGNGKNGGPGKNRLLSGLIALVLLILLVIGQQWLAPNQDGTTPSPTAVAAQVNRATAKPGKTDKPTTTAAPAPADAFPDEDATPIDPQEIADFLFAYGRLPGNFITKQEARDLGWDAAKNYVSDVAPRKSLGGDRFGNFEGRLPTRKGRTYYEADANYVKGRRTAMRVVYSTDGLVFYTDDHYETFTELFPSFEGDTALTPWRGGK